MGRWGTNTYIVAQSIGPTDIVGEGNGTVRVGKGRRRRIHVSNQRALVSKSERVEEGIEVRVHLARSALALAIGRNYTPPKPLSVSCKMMD